MSYVGHTGKVTGYNYDYLEKISEYTGWQMENVVYADADANKAVSQAMEDLQNGKVDLMGLLSCLLQLKHYIREYPHAHESN